MSDQIRELLDSLYRVDSGRILATLIRLLGDFDLAEEAMHEALMFRRMEIGDVPAVPSFKLEAHVHIERQENLFA